MRMRSPTALTSGRSGEHVVFLHGLGMDARCWHYQLAAFGRRFRAVAWNLPGCRDSEPLPLMSFPALADALAALFDQLRIDRAHLVGHSFGGMVAQQFLVQHSDRVRSATLFATSPAFGDPRGEWQQAFVRSRLEPLSGGGSMQDVAARMISNLFSADADPGAVAVARACTEDCPPETYRAAVHCLTTFENRENLPRICVPTLLLAAENDRSAAPEIMQKMASKIPGSVYRCLPAAGHLANLEQPEAFNETVLEFLSGHATA